MSASQQAQNQYDNLQPFDFPELPEISGEIEHQVNDDVRLNIFFKDGVVWRIQASDTQGNWHHVPAYLWDCLGEHVAYLEEAYDALLEREGEA